MMPRLSPVHVHKTVPVGVATTSLLATVIAQILGIVWRRRGFSHRTPEVALCNVKPEQVIIDGRSKSEDGFGWQEGEQAPGQMQSK